MIEMTYRDALRKALADAMTEDPDVIIIGEEVGRYGGAYGVTKDLIKRVRRRARDRHADLRAGHRRRRGRRGDDRAAAGRRAHVRRLHRHDDGPARQPGRQDPLHVRRPDRRADGAAHPGRHRPLGRRPAQPEPRRPTSCTRPGLRLAMPATVADAYHLLRQALQQPDPVVFIEHKALYTLKENVDLDAPAAALGQGGGPARGRRPRHRHLFAPAPLRHGGGEAARRPRASRRRSSTCAP